MPVRSDLRNVAIVAHVDHGKTTLVDALLWQSGAFRANQDVAERVLDTMDLEREKGITILAKNTAVRYGGTKINIVDTPGHADFGGEVERGLTMVDGVLLLVDASEGPLPQTRFVLRKALEARLPVILVVNKVDRPDARIEAVVNEVYELFLDLDADESADRVPDRLLQRAGPAAPALDPDPTTSSATFSRCSTPSSSTFPRPRTTRDTRSRRSSRTSTRRRTSAGSRSAAFCTGRSGAAQQVAWCRADGTIERAKVDRALRHARRSTASRRTRPARARSSPSPASPRSRSARRSPIPTTRGRCRSISVDEPSLSVTIGINTSPLAGLDGHRLTASQVEDRLRAELIGNVSLRVLPTERPDAWEVQGRGELQLAVLVEQMRREGFELTVGKPQVVTRRDRRRAPRARRARLDRRARGVPRRRHPAASRSARAGRRRSSTTAAAGCAWTCVVPARGLIGFRTEFLTETRGTGILHHVFEGFEPWFGELRTRPTGALVADRRGTTTAFALLNLQERGSLFVGPGVDVYEGMIVGENARAEDLDVNATKEKKLTNMRSSTADELVRLIPPRPLSLDQALEFIREDECVEVTPRHVRLRKVELSAQKRQSAASRKARGLTPV